MKNCIACTLWELILAVVLSPIAAAKDVGKVVARDAKVLLENVRIGPRVQVKLRDVANAFASPEAVLISK